MTRGFGLKACCCFAAGNLLSIEIKEISQCFSTSVPRGEISLHDIIFCSNVSKDSKSNITLKY